MKCPNCKQEMEYEDSRAEDEKEYYDNLCVEDHYRKKKLEELKKYLNNEEEWE